MGMQRHLSWTTFLWLTLGLAACHAQTLDAGSNARNALSCDAGAASCSACTPGRDETCNADPAMSALAGTCNPDGTCACQNGYGKTSSGKCGVTPAASCTPGQDQTCNADPAMSALAGSCDTSGSCHCSEGFHLDSNGRCSATVDTFPAIVAGTWLFEVGSGLRRASWVRFEGTEGGAAQFLAAGSSRPGTVPLYDCSGTGSWQPSAKPNTIFLSLPTGCTAGPEAPQTFTFGSSSPPALPGSLLSVTFSENLPPAVGHKFPASWCDASFTSCSEPYP